MKKYFLLFSSLWISLSIQATEWHSYGFDFPWFSYSAEQLLGSDAYVPDMFPMAVKLNEYVKEKVRSGQLKEKPVVYDIYVLNPYQENTLLEIYETPEAWRIHINCREHFAMYLEYEELKKIIDYFAHPEFTSFYGGGSLHDKEAFRKELFQKIDSLIKGTGLPDKKEYEAYRIGEMSVRYDGHKFRVFSGEEALEVLGDLVSQPIQYRDRILFADPHFLYIYEDGRIIKKVGVEYLLGYEESVSNKLYYQIYPDWINFYEYISDDEKAYASRIWASYCYSRNYFYDLK